MSRSRTYSTQGIVLKRLNFSEADRFITIFTKHYGKLRLIAKGIRRLNSRKKGHLELFTHVKIFAAKGKNIDIVTEAQAISSFPQLRKNLNRVNIAYLFVELVDQLTAENQAHLEIYHLLIKNLKLLNSRSAPKNLILEFEKDLLEFLGFGLPTRLNRAALESHIAQITEKPINSKKLKN